MSGAALCSVWRDESEEKVAVGRGARAPAGDGNARGRLRLGGREYWLKGLPVCWGIGGAAREAVRPGSIRELHADGIGGDDNAGAPGDASCVCVNTALPRAQGWIISRFLPGFSVTMCRQFIEYRKILFKHIHKYCDKNKDAIDIGKLLSKWMQMQSIFILNYLRNIFENIHKFCGNIKKCDRYREIIE